MIKNIYNTTLGSTKASIEPLKNSLVNYYIEVKDEIDLSYEYNLQGIELVFITGYSEKERQLPLFTFPILGEDVKNNKLLFIDVRMYLRTLKEPVKTLHEAVTNTQEFQFEITRSIFTALTNIKESSLVPYREALAVSFSKWITMVFQSSMSLNPQESAYLEIIAVYYYLTIMEENEVNEAKRESLKMKTKNILDVFNPDMVLSICNNIDVELKDAESFIKAIQSVVDSIRLKKLDLGGFFNTLTTSWFGVNAKDNLIVSIEHPATFLALVYQALNNKTYKRARLSTILINSTKKIEKYNFTKNVENVISEATFR